MFKLILFPKTFVKSVVWFGVGAVLLAAFLDVNLPGLKAQEIRNQQVNTLPPKFDAASIRPCELSRSDPASRPIGGAPAPTATPNSLAMICVPLTSLIQQAYYAYQRDARLSPDEVADRPFVLEGGPEWVSTDLYTVNAVTEHSVPEGQMRGAVTRALLEDRFKLKIRQETRLVPGYTLTVAKGGAKLSPFKEGTCRPDLPAGPGNPPGAACLARVGRSGPNMTWEHPARTMDQLANYLRGVLGRPVVNDTGVSGFFEIRLSFASDPETTPGFFPPGVAPQNANTSEPPGPSIFTAIGELSLKLEPSTAPKQFFVIDHVERPSEN